MVSEMVLILLFIAANGLLAMSEMAVSAARRVRQRQRARAGDKAAALALDQALEPSRFLSTVQIGITLIGILAGALGGATIAKGIDLQLNRVAVLAPYSKAISIGFIILSARYLSFLIGALAPNEVALRRAVALLMSLSGSLEWLSRLAHLLVWALVQSSGLVLRLVEIPLPARGDAEGAVTDTEILGILCEGEDTAASRFTRTIRTILRAWCT